MNLALLTIVLALLWCAATGAFTLLNLLLGAALGGLALFFIRDRVQGTGFWRRLLRIAALCWLFIRELALSAVKVAVLVLRPDMKRHLKPEIIYFPLSVTTDAEITLLANLITLTPGTLSIDVSDDKRILQVHVLSTDDREAVITEIRDGFEKAVAGAFR